MAARGDWTGREAERLRAESLLAEGRSTGKIVSDDTGTYIEEEGVFDPFTGKRLSPDEEAARPARQRPQYP